LEGGAYTMRRIIAALSALAALFLVAGAGLKAP
jgi:predicted small lipoprotein YifL